MIKIKKGYYKLVIKNPLAYDRLLAFMEHPESFQSLGYNTSGQKTSKIKRDEQR